jgi:large subunit ribosomal protein L17
MRHLRAGRKLGRNASHRVALMRNLSRALFEHGRIITTVEKAKAVRPFVEKLITLAKKNTLHSRRLALARLPDRDIIAKLFDEIGPRFQDRQGGYTRVIKRHERRLGDAGKTAFLELLKEGETKVQRRSPAPLRSAPETEEPKPAAPATKAEEPATPPSAETGGAEASGSSPENPPTP